MDISRRALIKSGLVAGGTVATGGFSAVGAHAVGTARDLTTLGSTLLRGAPGAGGYLPVVRAAGEPHQVRDDLGDHGADRPGAAADQRVLAFAQITDVHVVDVQSPARVEWVDRYDDAYQEGDPTVGLFGSAYRPQEMLTAHIAEAMVRAINEIGVGPGHGHGRWRSRCRPGTTPTTASATRSAGTSTSSTAAARSGPTRAT